MACFLAAVGKMQAKMPVGVFLLMLSLVSLVAGILFLPRPRSRALATLSQWRDVRAIGPLLDALTISVGFDRPQIVALLTDLLPCVQEKDAPLFPRSQRRKLMDALHFADNHIEVYFQVAIVKALARVGEGDALSLLQTLAADTPVTEYETIVRNAARESLPILVDRVERLHQSHQLLRPSITSESSAELLRPAVASEEAAPETLLRPTQNG